MTRGSTAADPLRGPEGDRSHLAGWNKGDLVLALAAALLGVVLLAGATAIGAGAGYDRIGPRFFPYAVAGGLLLLGAVLAGGAWSGRRAPAGGRSGPPINGGALALLAVALLVCLALLEHGGFVVAASLQFWLVARAFHSRRPARDAVVAVVLATVVYLVFSRGLGLPLPPGILRSLA